MKIVHVCLGNYFVDNYSYQENMLTKYHHLSGHDVEVITSLQTFNKHGKVDFLKEGGVYRNENDIQVTRLYYAAPEKLQHRLKLHKGVYEALEKAKPDVIFIHNFQCLSSLKVLKYIRKHKNVTVYADSHVDFSNSATNWFTKNILHKLLWKYVGHQLAPYVTRFYGVLPARVDFLRNVYGLPAEKCQLLVMGADDELVQQAALKSVKELIRKQYGLEDDDFVVMTGGKIDQWKTQTLLLMEAVAKINHPKLKLIVFGSVTEDLMPKVKALADGNKVQYIGWIQAKDSYQYFAAADLVVFPGRHSVFWEQVAAQGVPMLCKEWAGTTHVDLGGNVVFLHDDSEEEIRAHIENLLQNPQKYDEMKKVAMEKGMSTFSYSDIARRAINS